MILRRGYFTRRIGIPRRWQYVKHDIMTDPPWSGRAAASQGEASRGDYRSRATCTPPARNRRLGRQVALALLVACPASTGRTSGSLFCREGIQHTYLLVAGGTHVQGPRRLHRAQRSTTD